MPASSTTELGLQTKLFIGSECQPFTIKVTIGWLAVWPTPPVGLGDQPGVIRDSLDVIKVGRWSRRDRNWVEQ
jgi:hypothetical protein